MQYIRIFTMPTPQEMGKPCARAELQYFKICFRRFVELEWSLFLSHNERTICHWK